MSSQYASKSFHQSIIQYQLSGLTTTFIESEEEGMLITFAGGIGCEFEFFSIFRRVLGGPWGTPGGPWRLGDPFLTNLNFLFFFLWWEKLGFRALFILCKKFEHIILLFSQVTDIDCKKKNFNNIFYSKK